MATSDPISRIQTRSPMRVLLRQEQNGLLYAGNGQWTDNSDEAIDFEKTDRAIDEIALEKLAEVEVLIRFDNPALEIPLRLFGCGERVNMDL